MSRMDRQVAGTFAFGGDVPAGDAGFLKDQVEVPVGKLGLKLSVRLDALGKVDGDRSNGCVFHDRPARIEET